MNATTINPTAAPMDQTQNQEHLLFAAGHQTPPKSGSWFFQNSIFLQAHSVHLLR